MNTLTNEQRARIFAMYWGADVQVFNPVTSKWSNWRKMSFTDCNLIVNHNAKAQLNLTSLNNLNSEHAIKISVLFNHMAGSGYGKISYQVRDAVNTESDNNAVNVIFNTGEKLRIYKDTGEFMFIAANGDFVRVIGEYHYQVRQILINYSYAVPLFIETGHPDNGKTAIELGLAIDKTSTTHRNG